MNILFKSVDKLCTRIGSLDTAYQGIIAVKDMGNIEPSSNSRCVGVHMSAALSAFLVSGIPL